MSKYMLDGEPHELVLDEMYSAELLAEAPARQAAIKRSVRDSLLAETDWVVIKAQETGVPVAQSMADYRQALRDITTHVNWPNLADDDWPVKP